MSLYEERLQADLDRITGNLKNLSGAVQSAMSEAVNALLTDNRDRAAEIIIGDLAINRRIRATDRLCHEFVARHYPSAGQLRLISSTLRLTIALERIGDYAVTLAREAVQLSQPPTVKMAGDIETMAEEALSLLSQSMDAFLRGDHSLARAVLGRVTLRSFEKTFFDLVREGDENVRPTKDVLGLLIVLNRLERVVGQSKNICEETIFCTTGEGKKPKIYRVLFLDQRNDLHSQLAEAYARKTFSSSGAFASAGWEPERALADNLVRFMEKHGLAPGNLIPIQFDPDPGNLSVYHVIVVFGNDVQDRVPHIPFHTALMRWQLQPDITGPTAQLDDRHLAELLKQISIRVKDLMMALHGSEME